MYNISDFYKIEPAIAIADPVNNKRDLLNSMKIGDSFLCFANERSNYLNIAKTMSITIRTKISKEDKTVGRVWRIS